MLNLFTNAFYAVSAKASNFTETSLDNSATVDDGYKPAVSVSTRKIDGKVEIEIADNGIGISDKIQDKIFQPFFTTKPAGQGTGLGLSLSYDIIKAHGGEIKFTTQLNKGSQFIVQLPDR
jgi:signal transduction histidine kinase